MTWVLYVSYVPKDVLSLQKHLGDDESAWPKQCLIEVPPEIRADIDLVVKAAGLAWTNPQISRSIVGGVNAEAMKRWFIDVALWSGSWRAERRNSPAVTKTKRSIRVPIRQTQLQELFNQDGWQCRYCGIPIGGNREHFKKFARQIEMPELIEGRSDEARHGIYLIMMASYDHVVSHSRGGTDGTGNLVTACWPCQFGKYKFELLELGLEDPRLRKPENSGNWKGLCGN